jgi:hypothetical protein
VVLMTIPLNLFKAKTPTHWGQDYCFSSKVDLPLEQIEEMQVWCRERFGDPAHGGRYDWNHGTFFFRDENDAFEFRMRWC